VTERIDKNAIQVGHSVAVIVDKVLCKKLGLRKGSAVSLAVKIVAGRKALVITKRVSRG